MLTFQDDDDEEGEEIPLARKRKQPSASISHHNEGEPSTKEVKEDKAEPALKKKKNPEVATQGTQRKIKGEKKKRGKRKRMKIPGQRPL
jgi:hypothetical protein